RLRVFTPCHCALTAREARVAEVEMAGELGQKIVRTRQLLLHLRNLEIGGDARGLRKCRSREQDDDQQPFHRAKYPLRAFTISIPRRCGVMTIVRHPGPLPWLWYASV